MIRSGALLKHRLLFLTIHCIETRVKNAAAKLHENFYVTRDGYFIDSGYLCLVKIALSTEFFVKVVDYDQINLNINYKKFFFIENLVVVNSVSVENDITFICCKGSPYYCIWFL